MNDEQKKAVLEAIAQLVEKEPGKKPNVKLIEEIVGFDISADDRDAAYAEFEAAEKEAADKKAADEKAAADKAAADEKAKAEKEAAEAGEAPRVTNNYRGALSVCGTTIPAGETMPVPKFDAEHAVMKIWADRACRSTVTRFAVRLIGCSTCLLRFYQHCRFVRKLISRTRR